MADQVNRLIGRDLVRMELGEKPSEWNFGPYPFMRGSPNHKLLDKAFRLRFAARYKPAALQAAIKDSLATFQSQEKRGLWKLAQANEQGTASHFHHHLLALTMALSAAKEIKHGALLASIVRQCRGLWSTMSACSSPAGVVAMPGSRSIDKATGLARPWSTYRDCAFALFDSQPLSDAADRYSGERLSTNSLDTAGCILLRNMVEDGYSFGGPLADEDSPVLAAAMTVQRYDEGLVASAPDLQKSGGSDNCTIAWIEFDGSRVGGRGRDLADPPQFAGEPREISFRGAV